MWKAEYISYKGNTNFIRAYQGEELVWERESKIGSPFYIKAVTDCELDFSNLKSSAVSKIKYSLNERDNWKILYDTIFVLNKGDVIYLQNVSDGYHKMNNENKVRTLFDVNSGKINIGGDIRTIVYSEGMGRDLLSLKYYGYTYAFVGYFSGLPIVSASDLILPFTELSDSCYRRMFADCEYLEKSPKLPATTLGDYCYYSMFENCSALTQAPELPALKVSRYAYRNMFTDCDSLKIAPKISAKMIDIEGCDAMFYSCDSLTTVMELPFSEISNNGCHQMFENCISLQQVPPMEIKRNSQGAFRRMFANCSSLKQIKMKFNGNLGGNAAIDMFANCTSLTDANITGIENIFYNGCTRMFKNCTSLKYPPEINIKQVDTYCCEEMFKGCTSLLRSPILSTLTGKTGCYYRMFEDCVNLKEITCLLLDANLFTHNWVKNIPSGEGTFYKHPDVVWTNGKDGIPEGWTIENYTG